MEEILFGVKMPKNSSEIKVEAVLDDEALCEPCHPQSNGGNTMRTNESEYKRLEDTIESLKAENAELTKTIQHQDRVLQMYFLSLKEQEEDVHELLEDKRQLKKDRERLEWVLSDAGQYWLSFREDIDKEMEKAE